MATTPTVNENYDLPVIKDTFQACAMVEGFDGEDHTTQEILSAWAYLVKTGVCWGLQGWYGRNASALIEAGYITKQGEITESGRSL